VTAIALPDRLEGEGFVLRPLRAADAAAYAAAFRDDPELGRLLGVEEDPGEDAARERVGRAAELAVADARTDAFLGQVLLHSHAPRHRRCEVAYWLVPGAVALLVSWAFAELDLLRVEMTALPRNAGVDGLARRLGFTREGVLRARNVERGQRVDVVFYGVLREEWRGA
jgi:RimJ/RimL family protein N-acetyltransferase